eukprot:4328518-Prymnesium_polylepis.1
MRAYRDCQDGPLPVDTHVEDATDEVRDEVVAGLEVGEVHTHAVERHGEGVDDLLVDGVARVDAVVPLERGVDEGPGHVAEDPEALVVVLGEQREHLAAVLVHGLVALELFVGFEDVPALVDHRGVGHKAREVVLGEEREVLAVVAFGHPHEVARVRRDGQDAKLLCADVVGG